MNWNQHKNWCCCNVGNLNVDYEIRDCEGEGEVKGKGLFALRSFQKGDKVLIERPVLKFDDGFNARENMIDDFEQLPESIQSAIDDLHMVNADHYSRSLGLFISPYDLADFELRILCNRFSDGLFIITSRFNHQCLANCELNLVNDSNLAIISALTDIKEGEELSISYINFDSDIIDDPDMIYKKWDFHCCCPRCIDNSINEKVIHLVHMEEELEEIYYSIKVNQGSKEDDNRGYSLCEEIIRICNELGLPRKHITEAYSKMAVIAIRMKLFDIAVDCLDKAILNLNESIGGCKKTPKVILEKQTCRDHVLKKK